MNKYQKIIIGIGLALILLSGLFPAYDGELRKNGDNLKQYLGYYLIFSPPNVKEMRSAFNAESEYYYDDIQFNASIITSRYFIQIVTILLLMIGLVFLFKDIKFSRIVFKKNQLRNIILAIITIISFVLICFVIVKLILQSKPTNKKAIGYNQFIH